MISHNKTLAAQLYSEFQGVLSTQRRPLLCQLTTTTTSRKPTFPQRDIYIEKDASINEEIDRLRLATTSSLVSRNDVIIVASVSSIYGLGSPEDYKNMMVALKRVTPSIATRC